MTSTALATVVEKVSADLRESDQRVTVHVYFSDLGWPKTAAAALAFSWQPLGPRSRVRLKEFLGTHEKFRNKDEIRATTKFITELLRGQLFEVGNKLQAATNLAEAEKQAAQLYKFLET